MRRSATTRGGRWALAAFVITVAIGQSLVEAPTAGASTPAAVSALQSCLQESPRLLVLTLIDESTSLRKTDPTNERVVGIKAQLTGLLRLANTRSEGRAIDVEVRLVSFADTYRPLWTDEQAPTWRRVDAVTLPRLLRAVDAIGSRNSGFETDYVTALARAQSELAERSAELTASGGRPPCQALVWFTDGRYQIVRRATPRAVEKFGLRKAYAPDIELDEPGSNREVMDVGARVMCDPGGLIDQLRASDVRIFALALDQRLKPDARDFLRAASGGTSARKCGLAGKPSSGLYLPASRGSQLLFMFGGLFDTPSPVRFCLSPGRAACTFETVGGLAAFSLELVMPSGASSVVLRSPSGDEAELRPDGTATERLGSVRLTSRWLSSQAAVIDADLPRSTSDWIGRWRLSFVDRSGGRATGTGAYTLRLRADLIPSLLTGRSLTNGELTQLRLGLVRGDGRPAEPSPLFRAASIKATIVDPTTDGRQSLIVTREPGRSGAWMAPYRPPLDLGVPQVMLVLEGSFDLGPDISVAPQERAVLLSLRPPESFPRVVETSLLLPSVRGRDSTTGRVVVVGPRSGTGCFWVAAEPARIGGQEDIADIRLAPNPSNPADCLEVADGERRELVVEATPTQVGTGRAQGRLVFHLRGTSGSEIVTNVPLSFDMRPAPNVERAAGIFAALFLGGFLIPFGLLALLNWWGARFAPANLVRFVARDVQVTQDGELLGPDGAALELASTWPPYLENETNVGRERRFSVDGDRFELASRALGARGERGRLLSLFTGPYGVIGSKADIILAGSLRGDLQSFPTVPWHEIPLGLAGSWTFEPITEGADDRDMSDPHAELGQNRLLTRTLRGRLLLFVPAEAPGEVTDVAAQAVLRITAFMRAVTNVRPSDTSGESAPPISSQAFDLDDMLKPQ